MVVGGDKRTKIKRVMVVRFMSSDREMEHVPLEEKGL